MNFPVYKKYPNNLSYFKVLSPDSLEEIKITGNYYSVINLHAKILPERNFITDMLKNENNNWVEISGSEYEAILSQVKKTKKLLL